jgi:hypothetical protein
MDSEQLKQYQDRMKARWAQETGSDEGPQGGGGGESDGVMIYFCKHFEPSARHSHFSGFFPSTFVFQLTSVVFDIRGKTV